MRAMIVGPMALLLLLAPWKGGAQAANDSTGPAAASQTESQPATQASATRRKHPRRQAAPAVSPVPKTSTWTGPDPTKGPGIERLHELQRQGRCVVDEGYGRYTFCSDR